MSHSNIPNPKNISILGSLPPVRAVSSYCLELAMAICGLGKVQFISFKKIYPVFFYPGRDLRDDNTFPAVKHRNLKVRRRLTWYNPLTWVMEGLFTKAELLHAQWWSLPLAPIYIIVCLGFKLRHKPVVFTVHNVLSHEKSRLYDVILRMVFKLGDYFIVHSTLNCTQLIKFYNIPPGRVIQIPHGPLDFYARNNTDREMVRTDMGFRPENRVILLFGAIRPYKGVDTALEAFAKVFRKIPEARLVIAGKLWEKWRPYERLIDDLGISNQVTIYPHYILSKDVCKFFNAADLVVLPYHHFDSQSGAGATAISFRKPMIVTDVGGLGELVSDQRYVVPPRDIEALAETIVYCLQNPLELARMSEGAEAVALRMAWPAIAKQTWSVYGKALSSKITPIQ